MNSIFGETAQAYVTTVCQQFCPHCRSRLMPPEHMALRTFLTSVDLLESLGVKRLEPWANEPGCHPKIHDFVDILEDSSLGYAILTAGSSPVDSRLEEVFYKIINKMKKGGVVFSVDLLQEDAERIIREDDLMNRSYAVKALSYYKNIDLLKSLGISVRTNTVIGAGNIGSAARIIQDVADHNFSSSFCFVQHTQPGFQALSLDSFSHTRDNFREFLEESRLLTSAEIDRIIVHTTTIFHTGELNSLDGKPRVFNAFRGGDLSEAEIEEKKLERLREELLKMKYDFPQGVILPGEEFIKDFGKPGKGCLELMKQGRFPQLKIGVRGQIVFCCDLHDPITGQYNVFNLRKSGKMEELSEAIRTNPYIWICMYYNACAFSVNYVKYATSAGK